MSNRHVVLKAAALFAAPALCLTLAPSARGQSVSAASTLAPVVLLPHNRPSGNKPAVPPASPLDGSAIASQNLQFGGNKNGEPDGVGPLITPPFKASASQSHLTAATIPGAASLNTATDWPTFGINVQRTGYNAAENVLNTTTVPGLKSHWATDIGGPILTQPTLITGVKVNSVATDVVYAATLGDATKNPTTPSYIVALNAANGNLIWSRQFTPVQTNCDDFTPSGGVVGTMGTPTLDRASNRMYVVTANGNLHILSLSTGNDVAPFVQVMDPNNTAPKTFVYGSPTLNGTSVYVATASRCDFTPYHGQVVRVSTTNSTILQRWYPVGNSVPDGGGIWGPGGVSIPPNLSWVYAATGNAIATPENAGFAEHIVKLTVNLAVNDSSSPAPVNNDLDFGATPLLFQRASCPPMLAAMQKSGWLYIYNRNTIGSGPIVSFQIGVSTSAGNFVGIPAFDPVLNQIYVNNPVDSNDGRFKTGLVALSVNSDCSIGSRQLLRAGTSSEGNPSIPPVAANGVVYYADGVGSVLRAVNAVSGTELWNSNLSTVKDHITGGIFASPSVVNGQVFVAGYDHKIHAYGL
ncbi:PQQ-binding-like beta-propeller repeat protein [Paraburkholderia sediminicola]|uniref:PQQ-binding-like beta-propeller repeat protein n=1 Tax=Paraburkholderia rhynchosiae TaxID=487049 RepID=A0ACC7NN96_9BURK